MTDCAPPNHHEAMADRIGVDRRWYQYPQKSRSPHYVIALSKRALAVAAGRGTVMRTETVWINEACSAALRRPRTQHLLIEKAL